MTDGQVADEKFLVLVNDLLASGNSKPFLTTASYGFQEKKKKCFIYLLLQKNRDVITQYGYNIVRNCKDSSLSSEVLRVQSIKVFTVLL